MVFEPSIAVPIIAATSALCGVVVSGVFALILAGSARKYQRKILLREKYEELAKSLVDSLEDYLNLLASNNHHELLLHSRHAHAQKVDVLARLYFPELKQSASEYLISLVAFQNSLAANYDPKIKESVGVQGANSQKVNIAQKQLETAKQFLELAIEKHANKYAIA